MDVLIISSSRDEIDDYYKSIARSISNFLAYNECNLIFGGSSSSMMGICYDEFSRLDRNIYAYTTSKYIDDLKNLKNAKPIICETTFDLATNVEEFKDLFMEKRGKIK